MTVGDIGVLIREMTEITDPALHSYLDLYETAFPPQERIPVSSIIETLLGKPDDGGSVFLLAETRDDGLFAGFAHVVLLDRAVYLLYMAAAASLRGAGVGSSLLAEVKQMADWREQPMILEVEDPDTLTGDARNLAERRIGFYRRHGFRVLRGISYLQTVPFYPEGLPMLIMVCPGSREMPADSAVELAEECFGESVTRLDESPSFG